MNITKKLIYRRRKPTNWKERGVEEWVNDVRSVCRSLSEGSYLGYSDLANSYMEPARIYFALAARSRAKGCQSGERDEINDILFRTRSIIENALYRSISNNILSFERLIYKEGFFGCSAKQGISVRFPLFTCKPTKLCGGGCYAHDGRDKQFSSLARGVFNYIACEKIFRFIENKNNGPSKTNISDFEKQIKKAILISVADAEKSTLSGFQRTPRIRLSHVGEMTALPDIVNWLSEKILDYSNNKVTPVVYTRHPNAMKLDTSVVVVNFTIESKNDVRKKYAPTGSRLVMSSWGGEVIEEVAVNFIEHHGDKHFIKIGQGNVCPVTAAHENVLTCDTARCTKCFDRI